MEGEWRLADRIPARLTAREGRRFGLTVGLVFLALGGVSRWRGHSIAPLVLWTLGVLFTTGGLFLPGQLGPVHRAWMSAGHLLSRVTTPLFMGIVYFGVITPMGLLLRWFGRDPLLHRPSETGYWAIREPDAEQENSMRRQF